MEQQWRQEGGENGDAEDGGRVDEGEAVDPLFGRGAAALALFHQFDDVRQSGVTGGLGGADVDDSVAVDGAGKDGGAGFFRDGQALAGDRGLIDVRGAFDHDAVESDPLAGGDSEAGADSDIGGEFLAGVAIGADEGDRVGCDLQQCLHGSPGAADAPRLQGQGDREQEGDGSGLEPLPKRQGADDGDRHQQVHVRAEVAQGIPSFGQDEPRTGDNGEKVQQADGIWRDGRGAGVLRGEGCEEAAGQEQVQTEGGGDA